MEDDERWLLLDTDHYVNDTHVRGLTAALREAKLHHLDQLPALNNAKDIEAALRKALGGYDKTSLKREHFPVERAHDAARRARHLDGATPGNEIPKTNTTRVYRLWEAITGSPR